MQKRHILQCIQIGYDNRQFELTNETSIKAYNNKDAITGANVVKVGGGNATGPLTSFTPQQIEIKVGQSVMWYNPTLVAVPILFHSYWTINPIQTLLCHLLCQVPQNLWFYLLVLMLNPPWEDLP